jgi:hypothetical protein
MNFGVGGAKSDLGGAAADPRALPATDGQPPSLLLQTNDRKNRASETLDDVLDRELPRVHGELVPAHPTALPADDPVLREVEQDDGQEFAGNAFTFCELGDR